MKRPKDCGMCRHFTNGDDYDYCALTGEQVECYEQSCEYGEE